MSQKYGTLATIRLPDTLGAQKAIAPKGVWHAGRGRGTGDESKSAHPPLKAGGQKLYLKPTDQTQGYYPAPDAGFLLIRRSVTPTMVAHAAAAALIVLALLQLAQCQLPNARIGLHPSGDGPPITSPSQEGYPLVDHDIPFGERYEMKLKYWDIPRQPLYYKDKSPMDVACWWVTSPVGRAALTPDCGHLRADRSCQGISRVKCIGFAHHAEGQRQSLGVKAAARPFRCQCSNSLTPPPPSPIHPLLARGRAATQPTPTGE